MSNPSTPTAYTDRFNDTGEGTYAYMNTRPLRRLDIGSIKLQVPQVVKLGELAEAQAFTFHCVVSAVEGIKKKSVNIISKIGAVSSTMNQAVIGDTVIADFTECIEDQLMVPSNFNVVSFHDVTGSKVVDAMTSPGVLKPLGDESMAHPADSYRPAGIAYAQVTCTIDFDRVTDDSTKPCTHTCRFYVALPQGSLRVLVYGSLGNRTVDMTTYLGPAVGR